MLVIGCGGLHFFRFACCWTVAPESNWVSVIGCFTDPFVDANVFAELDSDVDVDVDVEAVVDPTTDGVGREILDGTADADPRVSCWSIESVV